MNMDYDFKTTFWSDFSIADRYGIEAIKDTYNRAFNGWKDNYIYLTELVLVLNWKIWQHYEDNNIEYAKLYNDLWQICDNEALEILKDDKEKLEYFLDILD